MCLLICQASGNESYRVLICLASGHSASCGAVLEVTYLALAAPYVRFLSSTYSPRALSSACSASAVS